MKKWWCERWKIDFFITLRIHQIWYHNQSGIIKIMKIHQFIFKITVRTWFSKIFKKYTKTAGNNGLWHYNFSNFPCWRMLGGRGDCHACFCDNICCRWFEVVRSTLCDHLPLVDLRSKIEHFWQISKLRHCVDLCPYYMNQQMMGQIYILKLH